LLEGPDSIGVVAPMDGSKTGGRSSLKGQRQMLKEQQSAGIIYNTSVLAYAPLALAAVYSSTKAALESRPALL